MEPENENETPDVIAVPEDEAAAEPEEKPEGGEADPDKPEPDGPTGLEAAAADPTIAELVAHDAEVKPLTLEDVKALTPEQKLVLARVLRQQADIGKAQQQQVDAAATARREAAAAQREALRAQKALLEHEPIVKLAAELRAQAAKAAPAELDPFDPASIQARIDAGVQAGVAAALDRLAAETQKTREALGAADAKLAADQEYEARAAALQAAIEANPYQADEAFLDEEGKDVKMDEYVKREFRAHPLSKTDPARAYNIVVVRAQRLRTHDRVEAADASVIERARASSRRPGRLRDTTAPPTPNVGGDELLEFYAKYPAARARDAAL